MAPALSAPGWRAAAGASALLVSLTGLGGCTDDRPGSGPGTLRPPTIGPGETTVRVLQLNLCNSGRADCYSGRAVGTAAALIRRRRPDVVSLNEVCREDVDVLERAMSASVSGAAVASAFEPARDRATRGPVRCRNGQDFGDGVLGVPPAADPGARSHGGIYPMQDPDDVEERVWVCLDLDHRLSACTTHLASTDPAVALAQCRHLLGSVPQAARRGAGGGPVVVAGDLNLAARRSPDPQSCLPRGYRRADDGGVQDVVVSPGVAIRSRSVIDLGGATDHPGLLVDLVLSRR